MDMIGANLAAYYIEKVKNNSTSPLSDIEFSELLHVNKTKDLSLLSNLAMYFMVDTETGLIIEQYSPVDGRDSTSLSTKHVIN